MKLFTHFIEQINDGNKCMTTSPASVNLLKKSEELTKKFNVNVVAVFKIYPKPITVYDDNKNL